MPLQTRLAALADDRLSAADKGLPARADGLTVREFLATEPALAEFWTPLLALDERALAHNASVIQGWCDDRGLELMPHGKTTMAPALWQLQLDAGATGLTLATPGQVRTARSFGIASIMLANTLVAPAALAFIAGELADPDFAFRSWVDSVETVEAMEHGLAGLALPRPIDVLVELGGAGGRTGARGVDEAVRIAERVAASPVLRLAGTAGYEGSLGHDRSPAVLDAVRGYLAEMLAVHAAVRGLADGELIVTAGGSAYLELVAEVFAPAIAEEGTGTRWILRSGASLLHDDGFYHGISPIDGELTPAMRGYARVVSHPEPGLALLDGGKRDFPYDEGLPVPFGVAEAPGAVERQLAGASVTALNDQHAYLRADGPLDLAIGEVVSLGLSHPCTAFDKWRLIPVVEGGGSDRVVALVRTFF
ncbi:D-serine deaminase-like pyridoxal phosphate-dependent protein [Agromyces cerinus]|uniref:alanine racemase n=1 Tax=Agromyces cerinus TaxID=33878 RepID=UPI00195964A0|nr:alanine racemase [Agromyces cerinus]MBM7829860.1 D-serine deaminase-like pyridoxal phosphate-dependent protein [Agromyces cerinus]